MAGFSTEEAAKLHAAQYLHGKTFGTGASAVGHVFNDVDPGSPGPTDPGPPPDDPTAAEVESYILDRSKYTMWQIGEAWRKGNP